MSSRQGLTTSQALALCKELGKPYTQPGLVMAGLRRGWSWKHEDGHWRFDSEKLREYVMKSMVLPELGWITIRKAAERANVSIPTIYRWIDSGKLPFQVFGPEGYVMYVREEDVDQHNRSKESNQSS